MSIRAFVVHVFAVCLAVLSADLAIGQDYPNRPIRIVAGAAGSGNDFSARQIAQGISGLLGQPVIVDNRVGGIVPQDTVSKAPPDGYTLLIGGGATWVFPLLQKAPYDMSNFSPISQTERSIGVLVVHPSLPVKSVKELITLAKAKPGALNYAAATIGGMPHLSGELFKSLANINMVAIHFTGTPPGLAALFAGDVQMTIADAGVVAPHVASGRLRALAITSAQPSMLAPGLPTLAASGVPGYESVSMAGIFAPASTSGQIVNRLNQEIVRFLNTAEAKERFFKSGIEVVGSSPEEFAATIRSETAKWSKVIKDAGIKVN